MNEVEVIDDINIKDKIYQVRGKLVILDSDLGKLYKCTNGTKDINKAVKRNKERFPEDFCFQLTKEEYYEILRFQSGTLEFKQGKYSKYLPYAFTESGVAMLSGILHTEIAINTSILIMKVFVTMKNYLSNSLLEQNFYRNMLLDHDDRIKILENNFNNKSFSNEIFFEGQIYDAYSLLLDILNSSKESIIIIDNFANKKLLDLLSKTNKKVVVYSKNMDEELISKYHKQYDNVELKYNDGYHDRFIIIDKRILYHCGASFKDLGKKCFCISKIDNIEMVNEIISKL